MTTPPAGVRPGVLYDWPTHVPMPEGYPPWGTDPVEWREESRPGGWGLPHPSEYGVSVTDSQLAGLMQLAALFGWSVQTYVEVLQEISGDGTKIFGYLNNVTLAFQREREAAYAGDEMSVGLFLLCHGPAGSGKSQTALWLLWRDFLARVRAGYLSRHGIQKSSKWARFGPWNFCADTIQYARNRTLYPDHVPTILDDPLKLLDAESRGLRAAALEDSSNLATKQRDRGRTTAVTNVFNDELDTRVFTDIFWHCAAMRIPDRFGYTIRMTRRSTDSFKFAGFLLPVSPLLDIGGPLAISGPVLLREVRKIKRAAHRRLYTGRAYSQYALDLEMILAENPTDAMDNCFTLGFMVTWLSPIVSSEFSYQDADLEKAVRHFWRALGLARYAPKRSKDTGSRWALFWMDDDDQEVLVHVRGDTPGQLAAAQFVWDVRSKLPLPPERMGKRPETLLDLPAQGRVRAEVAA